MTKLSFKQKESYNEMVKWGYKIYPLSSFYIL